MFGWALALDPEHYSEMCVRESQDSAYNSHGTYWGLLGGMEVVTGRGDFCGSGSSIRVRGGDLDIRLAAHDIIKTSTVVLPVRARELGLGSWYPLLLEIY